jgi:4-amino-4-deoxy-L-arabinose transferase-like glycosyltransferase
MDKMPFATVIDPPTKSDHPSIRSFTTGLRVRREPLALTGILIVGAILRFALLGRNSIWFDEAVIALVAQFKWQEVFASLRFGDTHPPLYYLLMKTWVHLVGVGEVALRIPSAFFSLISVVLTYALMRQFSSKRVSLVSALLVATAPFEIWSAQMARMYAFLGALTLGATLTLVLSVERRRWGLWGLYAVLAAAMVYTHDLAFFVLAAHGLWVISYERRHLSRWLLAMGTVAVLYAPWGPSLWYQVTHGPTWFLGPVLGDKPPYLKLSDLVGLFAFGGSLFGMPSYFFSNTSLTRLEQVLLLLPFLIVVGSGIALSHGRRQVALLGLSLALPVGVMQVVGLWFPAFFARWFSFLCPFYAMLFAGGAFALSRAIRPHCDRIAVYVVSAALLFNIAGLERYYFDPQLHPYQWRTAVATLSRKVEPADLLLFGDSGNEATFAYYFKGRAWTRLLLPGPDLEAIRGLGSRFNRVWLIVAPPTNHPALIDQTLSALQTSFVLVDGGERTPGVYPWVYLFEARPSPRL